MDRQSKRDAMVDDQKWDAAIAYTRAYNEWREAAMMYNDAFHPEVQAAWDILKLQQAKYKRMVKK